MPLIFLAKLLVYGVLFLSLAAALGVVLLPNIFHAALCLVGTLLGVAALYAALQAEFIAVVQILLYVGAVMTLVIFVVMLTHRIGDKTIAQANQQSLSAFVVLLLLVGFMGSILFKWHGAKPLPPHPPINTLALGKALLGVYVFPFEVVSIVLLAGLIGAVVIARKD